MKSLPSCRGACWDMKSLFPTPKVEEGVQRLRKRLLMYKETRTALATARHKSEEYVKPSPGSWM